MDDCDHECKYLQATAMLRGKLFKAYNEIEKLKLELSEFQREFTDAEIDELIAGGEDILN